MFNVSTYWTIIWIFVHVASFGFTGSFVRWQSLTMTMTMQRARHSTKRAAVAVRRAAAVALTRAVHIRVHFLPDLSGLAPKLSRPRPLFQFEASRSR